MSVRTVTNSVLRRTRKDVTQDPCLEHFCATPSA
jgi:hypothetical protein